MHRLHMFRSVKNKGFTLSKMKNAFESAATGALLGGLASFFIPFLGPIKGAMIGALSLVILGVVRGTGR